MRSAGPTATPDAMTVSAPAKVNLFLHVTGRRADGYHLLESLMVLIDLADTIRLSRRADGQILRLNPIAGVPVESDLAYRAARLLQQHTNTHLGVSIAIDKHIPLGSGLGGGSSDAASVLLALNRLWSLDLSRDELMRVALPLGADVPFFVFGSNAHVTGIGEVLQPVTIPRMEIVLAIPSINVPTAEIFAAPALVRDHPLTGAEAFVAGYGCNDLQPVAVSRYPDIADALASLATLRSTAGPGWPTAESRMSGSGSTVFRMLGQRAAKVRSAPALRLIETRTLASHPLREFVAK